MTDDDYDRICFPWLAGDEAATYSESVEKQEKEMLATAEEDLIADVKKLKRDNRFDVVKSFSGGWTLMAPDRTSFHFHDKIMADLLAAALAGDLRELLLLLADYRVAHPA